MAWKICRSRRRTYFYDLKIIRIFVIAGILFGMLFLGFEAGSRVKAAETEKTSAWRLVGFQEGDWQKMISQVLPMASYMPDYVEDESAGIIITAMKDITASDLNNPVSFIKNQIAYFDARAVNAEPEFIPEPGSEAEPPAIEPDAKLEPDKGIIPDGTQPLVGIYCTHSAESYLPSQGAEKLEGKNGGVFMVASHLKETLEQEYGIKAVLSDTVHDYPDWSKSYANSLKTIENMKRNYPSIQLFIDVHRDANTPKDSTTVKIDGQKTSKIMLIVGSDHRLPHPAWKKNRDFAQNVAAQMEDLYPGLLKGVRIQDGRYNQHVSSRAILLEMGGTENTLEETKRSAEMFAGVINNMAKRR